MLREIKDAVANRSRAKRAQLFIDELAPNASDKILDFGGGRGHHFGRHFPFRENVYIAENRRDALDDAERFYGFKTRLVDGTGRLPFDDKEFDILFCSSVVEHVTGPKLEAIELFKADNRAFRRDAWNYQVAFANELRRTAKSYFIQTPNRWFPIEVHTWIPLIGLFSTHVQWRVIRLFNSFWPNKMRTPDWALLSFADMKLLFPEAKLHKEKYFIFTKSIIAIYKDPSRSTANDVH